MKQASALAPGDWIFYGKVLSIVNYDDNTTSIETNHGLEEAASGYFSFPSDQMLKIYPY